MIGKTISHYEILEKIGEGGMGVVYKARDTKLDRVVALKFLHSDLTDDPDAKDRLVQEARAAAQLDHPNICTVHEIDDSNEHTFISMSYIEGQNLDDLIACGSLPVDAALDIALQVAEGLKEAHEKGIIHRDIKSANIMVTNSGQVKIMDFGLVKYAGRKRLTKTGTRLGTVSYMSPEQACGEEVDHRSDIWSFGVMFYEMLTGQLPFSGELERTVMASIVNEEPVPLTSVRGDVPGDLEIVVRKSLAKRRDTRYSSTDELILDLQRIRAGDAVLSRDIRRSGSAFPYFLDSPKGRIVVAAALICIVGVAALLFRGYFFTGDVIDSIAVLPFVNVNHEDDIEWLSEGIPEGIISSLRKLSDVRIIPFSTLHYHYKGKQFDPMDVGRTHQVETVVFSDIAVQGNEIVSNMEIIDARSGNLLYANQYKSLLRDVASMQSDITRDITERMGLRMTSEEAQDVYKLETSDPLAYEYYKKGRLFWSKRTTADLDSAMAYFDRAIGIDPDFALAYSGKGDTYLRQRTYAGAPLHTTVRLARTAAERALALDPTIAESHATMGRLLNFESRYFDAQKELEKAIEIDPNYIPAYHWLAQNLADRREYLQAAGIDMKALEIDPQNPVISYGLAVHYISGVEYARGHEQLKKTMKHFPDQIGVKMTYSFVMDSLNDVNRIVDAAGELYAPDQLSLGAISGEEMVTYALQAARDVLARDSTSLKKNIEMGQLYVEAGQFDSAIRQFRRTLHINPDYAAAYLNIGIMYRAMKKYSKSIEFLNRSLRLDPMSPQANYQLALTYRDMGEYEKAEVEYKKALELNPFNVAINLSLEGFYFQTRQYEEAVKYFGEMATLYPNESTILHQLHGKALALVGEFQSSVQCYERAVDLDPLSSFSNATLSSFYRNCGNLDNEQEILENMLKMKPKFSYVHFLLGMKYFRQGKYRESAYNLHEAVVAQRAFSDNSQIDDLYNRNGDNIDAFHRYLRMQHKVLRQKFGTVVSARCGAMYYTWMNEPDSAFMEIETLLKNDINGWYLRGVFFNIHYIPLHSDPRWDRLLEELELDQYSDKLKRN
jgi:serine/threonine protein kinase/Tfp pilus assembly protein PilF